MRFHEILGMLWEFDGNVMGFYEILWDFYGNLMGFYWNVMGI